MNNTKPVETKNGALIFFLAVIVPNVIGAVIIMIGSFIYGKINGLDIFQAMQADPMLFFNLFVIQTMFLICTIIVCKGVKNIPEITGLKKPTSFMDGLMSFAVSLGTIMGLMFITELFLQFLGMLGYTPLESSFPEINTFLKYVFGVVFIAILPAVSEEFIFRGIIFQSLVGKSKTLAVVFSSVLFMLMHASPLQTMHQFIMGLMLAFVVLKTGNLFYSILIHFFNNFTAITFEYFGAADIVFPWYAVVAGLVLVVVALIYFARKPQVFKKIEKINEMEVVYSDNERMNEILKRERMYEIKGNKTQTIVLYTVAILFCLFNWGAQFIAGLGL